MLFGRYQADDDGRSEYQNDGQFDLPAGQTWYWNYGSCEVWQVNTSSGNEWYCYDQSNCTRPPPFLPLMAAHERLRRGRRRQLPRVELPGHHRRLQRR